MVNELASLLDRHRAFWTHQDGGEPLVRLRPSPGRKRFEHVDVRPSMLNVEALTPRVGVRDMNKRLVQGDLFHTECAFPRIPWMEAMAGCEIRAGADEAMWPRPALGPGYEGLERIIPNDDNPWLLTLLRLTRSLVEAQDGSYLVTPTLQRGPIDVFSALLGDVRMGLAFYDDPEVVAHILRCAAQAFIKVSRAQLALIPPFHGGWATWNYGLWAPGTVVRLQSDSASQISPRMYYEHVLPHDRAAMEPFDYSIIDLHSGGTLHLYGSLLEAPELDAISVTLDPYESAPTLGELLPTFEAILERKSLSVFGELTLRQVDQLRKALPSGCLSLDVTLPPQEDA